MVSFVQSICGLICFGLCNFVTFFAFLSSKVFHGFALLIFFVSLGATFLIFAILDVQACGICILVLVLRV